jgi:aldehyde:ferredoxin oxidoreductase
MLLTGMERSANVNKEGKIRGALAGKILRVELSTGKVWTENSEPYAARTLGGRGTNSLILINEIEGGTRWEDPENLLCFGVGSLVGTAAPGACRTDISTINVFSGGKGSANVGGSWGAELKYAGFDHIIIRGKAERPVYLYINDDRVEIRDADWLWGKKTYETENLLRQEIGDEGIEIAAIGPAGENRVRGSAVLIDTAKAAGGSGVGCVMGDKKLKAVVVRGHGKIDVYDPHGFMEAVAKTSRQCEANLVKVQSMRRSGAARFENLDFEGWETCMVIRNGQDDYWAREKRAQLMNPEGGISSMRRKVRACFSCPTGCMPFMEKARGKYGEMKGEGFWINALWSIARFDISDPETAVAFWLLANELGLDTDYVAAGLAWIFECYERGFIDQKDTDGLKLTWGNGEALIQLMHKLAYREGIGNLLADGMVEAAQKIGKGSDYYLTHVKGQPSIEPFRIPKGWGLGVATSPVAGRHLRGTVRGPAHSGPGGTDYDITHYPKQAQAVVWQGKTKELEDNLGICNYVGTWSGAHFLTPQNYAEMVRTAMGLPVTEKDLMEHYAVIGRNLEKAFNTLHTNLTREDDLPPLRFRQEEIKTGPYKGFKADEDQYNAMLDEFYELWGWDKKTGMQTREGLEKIGLKDVADKLAGKGRLEKGD